MALHHKLCHTLGGSFNLPHAQTHAIVLPHAARIASDSPYPNPRPIEYAGVLALLRAAHEGSRPEA